MLEWSDRARKAVASFFVKWNDLDVFVEDTAVHTKNAYVVLVNRILQGRAKVENVFPLGNRKAVLDACADDKKKGGRNRIYLIDADLDLAAGLDLPRMKRLYCHDVYHLENYFMCEDALVKVLQEENPRYSPQEVKLKLDFKGFLNEVAPLLDVFLIFGVTRILEPSLPTTSLGIGTFAVDSRLDPGKVLAFSSARLTELRANHSEEKVQGCIEWVTYKLEERLNKFDIVAARDFMFPLLKKWIALKGFKLQSSKEGVFFRLCGAFALDKHENFKDAVSRAAVLRN